MTADQGIRDSGFQSEEDSSIKISGENSLDVTSLPSEIIRRGLAAHIASFIRPGSINGSLMSDINKFVFTTAREYSSVEEAFDPFEDFDDEEKKKAESRFSYWLDTVGLSSDFLQPKVDDFPEYLTFDQRNVIREVSEYKSASLYISYPSPSVLVKEIENQVEESLVLMSIIVDPNDLLQKDMKEVQADIERRVIWKILNPGEGKKLRAFKYKFEQIQQKLVEKLLSSDESIDQVNSFDFETKEILRSVLSVKLLIDMSILGISGENGELGKFGLKALNVAEQIKEKFQDDDQYSCNLVVVCTEDLLQNMHEIAARNTIEFPFNLTTKEIAFPQYEPIDFFILLKKMYKSNKDIPLSEVLDPQIVYEIFNPELGFEENCYLLKKEILKRLVARERIPYKIQ